MLKGILGGLLLAAITGQAGLAADDVCVELAKVIGINSRSTLSQDQQRNVYKADLCVSKYNESSGSKRAQVEAAYKVFSFGASGSTEEITKAQESSCDNKFGDFWRSQLSTLEEQTVSTSGVEAISNCLLLRNAALIPNMEMTNNGKEYSVGLHFKPEVNSSIDIRMFSAQDLQYNKCKVTNSSGRTIDVKSMSDVAQKLQSSGSVSIACSRESEEVINEGVKYDCTRETLFVIATSGPMTSIKIPRVCSQQFENSKANELLERISAADERIQNTALELGKLGNRYSQTALSCLAVTSGGQNTGCPDGYMVAGCYAGQNKASHDVTDNGKTCHTHEPVDWTGAHCCKISLGQ
ncbi:hypothetical protein CN120_15595 [Sinorhizobium meliloti]|uniref:hypothetical protein n=1 Tax=Rhizobium meliloti TaxID=382 RepID=UPI000FD9A8D8|nr:hypothetical protein [Sinorhizobium meliloti]RVN03978.1 hypothetical protein CN120_15595 [Sinorhizobium meliloti]